MYQPVASPLKKKEKNLRLQAAHGPVQYMASASPSFPHNDNALDEKAQPLAALHLPEAYLSAP